LVWVIEFDEAAKKELAKLNQQLAQRLLDLLTQRVISLKDPRSVDKALKGPQRLQAG
jgi:mRNA interferase RelE/StbE